MNVNNNKGFSLIELMVVVAIIGILATVAVPNFISFQSKARQSSAKIELSAIYTAQQAFFAENTQYHNNLHLIGFVPDGWSITGTPLCPVATVPANRIYNVGFNNAADLASPIPITCATRSSYANTGTAVAFNATGAMVNAAALQTFRAQATGSVSSSATNDVWTIDNAKLLTNNVKGF